jgi:hypothetical protein
VEFYGNATLGEVCMLIANWPRQVLDADNI